MRFLNFGYAVAVVQVASEDTPRESLVERLQPFIDHTPLIALNMDGVLVTSLLLGDLVNLANAAQERWGSQFHHLLLWRLPAQGQRAIETAKLDGLLRAVPSLDELFPTPGG